MDTPTSKARIERVALPPWGNEINVNADGGFTPGPGGRLRTHSANKCGPGFCCLHNPSDHVLKDAPMTIRMDREVPLIERICEHGVGHADPDSVAYFQRDGKNASVGVHGCDGCC